MKRQKSEELNNLGGLSLEKKSKQEKSLDTKIDFLRTCVEKLVVDIKNRFDKFSGFSHFVTPPNDFLFGFYLIFTNFTEWIISRMIFCCFRNNSLMSNGNGVNDSNKPEVS